jgi:trigger factor
MKKSTITCMAAGLLCLSILAGCGKDTASGDASTASADASDYRASDYVTLCDYEGLSLYKYTAEVSDDDLQSEIESILEDEEEYTEITDRGAEATDYVMITADATVDGETYEDECYDQYEYIPYSDDDYLTDEFDDEIIGMKVDETKTITVTMPDDYEDSDIAGKEVTYEVTIDGISEPGETPEWNDAFISDYTDGEYTTTADYEEYLRASLLQQAEEESEDTLSNDVWTALINGSTISGYPDGLYDETYASTESELTEMADSWGLDVDTLLSLFYGCTLEEYVNEMISYQLVYEALVEQTGMTLSDDEYQSYLDETYASFDYDSAEDFEFLNEKLTDYVLEKATITEVSYDEYLELTSSDDEDTDDSLSDEGDLEE